MSKLKAITKKQMTEMFENYRKENTVVDENRVRKAMIFSVMKVFMDRLVNEKHMSVSDSINTVVNLLNDYAEKNPDYLPPTAYKQIQKKIKEYSVNLNGDISEIINKEFLSTLANDSKLSKNNALHDLNNTNPTMVEAVTEGYRKEILNKFYKANDDIWFRH